MTEENKIEQLLKTFYDGGTTSEEEMFLLNFFNSENLNEKWHTEREIFNALYDTSDISLPKGFAERLEKVIDKHIAETDNTKNEVHDKKNIRHQKTRKLFISISSAAAVILLCIGLFFVSDKNSRPHKIADTYTNPDEAAIVAEQMLIFVSTKLNQGFSSLEKIKESVDKTNELLNKTLK